jgi:hypothetical protein
MSDVKSGGSRCRLIKMAWAMRFDHVTEGAAQGGDRTLKSNLPGSEAQRAVGGRELCAVLNISRARREGSGG